MIMMAAVWSVVFLTLLVLAPLAWCAWRDRRQERALALRARIRTALRHAFKGESLLSVQIVPPALWHRGQVRLYAPAGWEWLIETAWPFVIKGLPEDYEVVVRHPLNRLCLPPRLQGVPPSAQAKGRLTAPPP